MSILVAAAVVSAFSSISAARTQKKAAEAQNKLARQQLKYNNEMRRIQQRDIIAAGDVEADNINAATRRLIGQQKVGYAGQGVDVDSEVAQQLKEEARYNAQEDAKAVRMNAAKKAWGIEIETADASAQNLFNERARTNMANAQMVEAGVSGFSNIASASYKTGGGGSSSGVYSNSYNNMGSTTISSSARNTFSSTQITS